MGSELGDPRGVRRRLERERAPGEQAEEAEVVEQRGQAEGEQGRALQGAEGRAETTGSGRAVSLPSRIVNAISPIAIRTAVPKNGPRQEMLPRAPPRSGPTAMPRPSAASNKITALSAPPLAATTIVARAVEMNRASPSPEPARKPDDHADAVGPRRPGPRRSRSGPGPSSSVRLAPIRLDTKLVKNMARPVTSR